MTIDRREAALSQIAGQRKAPLPPSFDARAPVVPVLVLPLDVTRSNRSLAVRKGGAHDLRDGGGGAFAPRADVDGAVDGVDHLLAACAFT